MKVSIVALLVLLGLSFVCAEIVPRFPGEQPLFFYNVQSNVTSDVTEFKRSIDSFEYQTQEAFFVVLTEDAPPVVTQSRFDFDPTTILGSERDIIIIAEEGSASSIFTAGVSANTFSFSTGATSRASNVLQYDGIDNGDQNLNTNPGLGGVDLTLDNASGFLLRASADIEASFTLTVVDSNGNSASASAVVVGDQTVVQDYNVPFSAFTGVDFTSVAAIQFEAGGATPGVDFLLDIFGTYGNVVIETSNCFEGTVAPCDTDYYRLQDIINVVPGDYITIDYEYLGEPANPFSGANLYVLNSKFYDLQSEVAVNTNIKDTLGGLPGPKLYDYRCNGTCEIEIVWSQLKNNSYYYLAVEGTGPGYTNYEFCLNRRNVSIRRLSDSVSFPVFSDQRPTVPPRDTVLNYSYFAINVPQSIASEGTYLVVNISRAQPFPGLRLSLMHESLPGTPNTTGVISQVDINSYGKQLDNEIFPYCVDTTGSTFYENPRSDQPRIPCTCFTQVQLFGTTQTFQLTCNLTVDPCHFKYGTWYASVELPERSDPENPLDDSGIADYTLTAIVVQPSIVTLFRNSTFVGAVDAEAMTHYRLVVGAADITPGQSHLIVQISNIRNGAVNVFVHKGQGNLGQLAGPEGCSPANVTCTTSDACNLVVEKCHFSAGTWYIGVSVSETDDSFDIFDEERAPITYTIRANWVVDAEPTRLTAGVPVSRSIGEALYDFYVINVPTTIDTWLFVELYAKAQDTEVIISMLHGSLPGGDCYARPDFYCMTGDPTETRVSTGPPTFLDNEPVQRESCSFMIQTCELQAGPLYISVYGQHAGYAVYSDTTYYQVPVQYTLWADFDVALPVASGVAYSETVSEKQYQHYYIRADDVPEGSWLSVEVTNIQHGIPQTLETFVNYNFLAGDCPCYDNLYNCTGDAFSLCPAGRNFAPRILPAELSVLNCCTIIVPPSDFKSGVWYIGILGVNEDLYQYTTPIGYTLTVTIHDAPKFNPLILGQEQTYVAPQYNETLEYVHFKLAAVPIYENDLVIKLTWVQSCDYMGKQDDGYWSYTPDALNMYVNVGAPAGANPTGNLYSCSAAVSSDSYCTIVIPHCEWVDEQYFIAVRGDYEAVFDARFTILATLDPVRSVNLTDNVPYYDRVAEGRYKHYFIETTAEESQYLNIDVYTNQDQDAVTVYLNKDVRAGDAPCFTNFDSCESNSFCTWQLLACDLSPGRYYISVRAANKQFYAVSTEFTILAAHKPVVTDLNSLFPITGHLYAPGQVRHYSMEIDEDIPGTHIRFLVDNVQHGAVTAYLQYGALAGRCPCFVSEQSCSASSVLPGDGQEWCELRVPSCEVKQGTYFFSIFADELISPDPLAFITPIGFTVEIDVYAGDVETPEVDVGRNPSNIALYESVTETRYRHYEFDFDDEDFSDGYHVIVEISEVNGGSITAYYNPLVPGDFSDSCHAAEICTSGIADGTVCRWQLPHCLVRGANTPNKHYITIHGLSGRNIVFYHILIWKQPVPRVVSNPSFTLDGQTSSAEFPTNAEVNITHSKFNEPNGWTQFIRLQNVPARTDDRRGEMLELFFYRVQNNIGEPIAFNVYVAPNEPAGAHGCCDTSDPVEMASCQNAPCSQTADTTTQSTNGGEIFSHVCSLGTGAGHSSNNPFFGERCTVRVWPCEFNKYCGNETVDWFVSVVPIVATDPASTGNGLTYSFQWRTRDIRLFDSIPSVGTVDLTPEINNYDFGTEYTVRSFSSDDQGWRSFAISYAGESNQRLSIQTRFVSGTGVVYINRNEFASPTDSCNDYECTSTSNCDGENRFINTESCSDKGISYWITVRNTGVAQNSDLVVSFRITTIQLPEVIEIPSHPTRAFPFTYTSTFAPAYDNILGVQDENYNFFTLTIDDDDLDENRSWIIDIDRVGGDSDDTGALTVFIRFGEPAGNYGTSLVQNYYGNEIEGNFAWQYSCELPTPDSSCFFQIPHCNLVEGHWYISFYNAEVVLEGTPSALPQYTFTTYIDDVPTFIPLNTIVTANQNIADHDGHGAYLTHYRVNVTAEDLAYDNRADLEGYWTRWLRFQIQNLDEGDVVQVYINYDSLAGPIEEHSCLSHFATFSCESAATGCFYDVLPCEQDGSAIKLVSGSYFISILTTSGNFDNDYELVAQILQNEYSLITQTATVVGDGNRLGTENVYYSYTVSNGELNSNGDGFGHYRYVIDIPADADDDDLPDNEYLIFNISTPATVDGSSISFELWRDDCTRFNCETSGPESWCVIDALTLSPCSAKSGRYYMRVDNENAIEFTIEAFLNQTAVQTIEDRQILTEIIYPYEYQEYFYDAQEVGEGSTLTVRVCSLCGDVQVWLRADMPAGPSSSSNDCAIASCEASSVVSGDFDGADDDEQCCVIFLDSCEYAQRGYYVGIRGVDVEYPNDVNPFIYTPIRYNVEVYQTNINFTQVSPSCPSVVAYSEPAYIVPNQYFVDIETVNIGSSLRFSLRVPEGSNVTGDNEPTISVNYNTPVGYSNSDVCATDLLAFTCSSTTYCSFEIPYCAIPSTPRFYISTTAPRGSEILVERFDPIVSIIQPNINYQATINGPDAVADNFVVPYKPNKQYYRFDMAPWGDENFYERFYVRVVVSGVRDGLVSLAVNSGNSPYAEDAGCDTPVFFASCNNIGSTCYVDIQYSDIVNNPDDKFSKIPKTFWVTIEGVEQNCELKSISYELIVQSHWVVTYFPVGKTICNNVGQDEYNFHRLKPHQVEYPQESILRFTINDIDDDEIISVLLQDSYLPTVDGNQLSESNFLSDTIEFDWICGYDDLYISVHGDDVDNDGADYRMNVEKVKVPVKELFDDSVYHHDDDDDDACPHDHDFYIFKTAQPRGHHAGSFFRVLVDSEFNTRVYVNKDTFAWGPCFDSGYGENNPEITGTTSVNVYDFCDFADGIYYITVVADGPYYIYTNIRDDAKNLTLGQVFRDELEPAMYQVYSLEICKDWYEADDRLVIEISDVQNGDVQGWIRKDGVPGEFQNDEETGSCASDTALARYGAGESGYDFLLVNSCQLEPGTYYILIRAAPHPGSPERNCQHVTYRLFPYLIDYQIDPIQVAPNTQISDTVDYYTINRESIGTFDPFIRYYSVDPLNVGFNDDADHAVVRLANVEGGLLRLRIANDHLAIPQNAYIEGEIYALTKSGLLDPQWKMQSGARPNTYQRVLDNADATAYSECDVEGGCANYCSTMSTAGDEYSTDSSIAIWLPSCFYAPETVYIAVEAVEQYYQDHPITYDLVVTQTRDYIIIQPDTNHLGEFSDNNWDYDFYYSISAEPESMRWRVVVTSGEGVLVTVHNHRCPLQSTWTKTIWCDAAYFDRPWLCDIEIATEAAHPGDNAFFLSVYGKNATYSIAFWRGRENCHDFTGAGRAEGLDFCSGLVPYATWRWDNYETLDNEASCFFDQLYQQFRVQPCYTGVTPECNSTLKAFACYESFHACDHNGFAVPTCRSSCNAVVYECANWFDSVDLEHYNCTSSRYADGNAGTCTGNDSFDAFTLDSQLFLGQPELILFKSSPENAPVSAASASVYSVALTLVFAVIVLII